ncbi:MAG TPA: glycosyltransferase [Candidatus Acidoferrales bacterium]|nr:glycosyltransferase [Candidatus Acidoferrales bacterium]
MPTVSVIVPNYNHARFLRERLDSILEQTYDDFELILLDDASTDDSPTILREYASHPKVVHLHFNEKNSGSTFAQWNKGVRLARGQYVWIAESDDFSAPQFLARLVDRLRSDSDLTLVCCRSRYVAEDGSLGRFADTDLSDIDPYQWTSDFSATGVEMCRKYFHRGNAIANASSVLFTSDAFRRVGGADESFRYCGDWALWAALSLEGRFAYVCEHLNYFRLHEASVGKRLDGTALHAAESLRVTRWVLERVPCPPDEVERERERKVHKWVPALLSFRTPFAMKWRIAMDVRAIDPHAFRRALRPALAEIRIKLRRHWSGFHSLLRRGKYASR